MEEQVAVNNPEAVEQPKLLTQEQVNKIVAHEKSRAAESARREAEERYQREIEALNAKQMQRNAEVPRDVDADAIYQQIQERFNKEMQERQLKSQM